MTDIFKKCLWRNFGAAIDMLKNAIAQCPDEVWQGERKFFYLAYHTIIFLDYYLSHPVRDFHPQLSFTLLDTNELPIEAIDDVIPDKEYSREEMLDYITLIREKCRSLILSATENSLDKKWIEADEVALHGLCPPLVEKYTLLEILFYNLRHVQHHTAQMNLILRMKINKAPDWVSWVND